MAAAKTSRLPMLVSLQQTPSFSDCRGVVVATFFQPRKSTDEPPEASDSEEEECEIEPDSNNNVNVTISVRTSESPGINCTEATIVRQRSTSGSEEEESGVPNIVVHDIDASDDEAEESDDSGHNKELEHSPDSDERAASVKRTFVERQISRSVGLKPEELVSKINEYDRISTVGTGTFGRVTLVQHKYGSRGFYALKIMSIREVIRNRQIEHVHSEKNILLSVDHPFIIKLHWAYHDTKFVYMLFDYAAGGELFSYLRCARKFCNNTARFYTAEIVLALEYLHSVHVVYRDLKPENILLDKDGHVRLTDFGFAKQLTEGRTFTMCGTPEYLAPEVVAGKGHNAAVDWWSLGILVYEMLTGRTPFPGDDSHVVYEQILERRPKFPKGFDSTAKDLIRRLLVVNRVKRLGNLKGGAEDVKAHKWFSEIDWTDVYEKKLQPPIRPTVNGEGDTGNFDEYDEDDKSQVSEGTPDDLELFEDW